MKYLIIILLLAAPLAGTAQDKKEDDYNPRWVFSPFNINVGLFKPGFGALTDSLHAAGYGKIPALSDLGGIDLEVYHKSHLMLAFAMNFSGSEKDTLIKSPGYYNMIRELRHMNTTLSVGYNMIPLRRMGLLTVSPKVGIYLSRFKANTTNFNGDTLLLPSVFGNTARQDKTVRYWESGIEAGLKISCTPFYNSRSMLALLGIGVEAGMQYNTRMLLNGRSFDTGNATAVDLPGGPDQSSYVRLELQLLRGVWCVQKKRADRHSTDNEPKLML